MERITREDFTEQVSNYGTAQMYFGMDLGNGGNEPDIKGLFDYMESIESELQAYKALGIEPSDVVIEFSGDYEDEGSVIESMSDTGMNYEHIYIDCKGDSKLIDSTTYKVTINEVKES